MFMTLICRMSLIFSEIGAVRLELWALNFTKLALFCLIYTLPTSFFHQFRSYIHTCNVYDYKLLGEYCYEINPNRRTRVMNP